MHDFDAHIRAVEEDLEYYRAKRFEPRVFYLLRRNVVMFSDLLKARVELKRKNQFFKPRKPEGKNIEARVRYLEEWLLEVFVQALIQRGWSTREELEQRWKQLHEQRPWAGGVIVAKAWTDPEFKHALLATGREALREMGVHQGKVGKLVVVENTDKVHNVIVCTLCSCYPYDILGDTPWWYKHESYRTNIVQNPRACIRDMFGLNIPAGKEVQVYDSTSDVRYFVLPQQPAGTEEMSENELAKLVTVDSLIGAGYALEPAQLQQAEKLGATPETPRVRPD